MRKKFISNKPTLSLKDQHLGNEYQWFGDARGYIKVDKYGMQVEKLKGKFKIVSKFNEDQYMKAK